ncbi:MAG: Do family serine endopeptidase [Flammeovirgaceae bacterium]|nr:Do family serine endopeptidase [Flammeovirgaceae bacterium]MDW8287512.1 Do family serine endopeptidase [Flammeovirgaceae bacterium]
MSNTIKIFGAALLASLLTAGVFHYTYEPRTVLIEKSPTSIQQRGEKEDSGKIVKTSSAYFVQPNGTYVDFSEVAEKVTPAVVHIRSTIRTKNTRTIPSNPFDFFFGPDFRQFENPAPTQSSGSGVIISPDGYILTNNHVIEGADEVEVILHDKRNLKGKVVGTDPSTDIALIQVRASGLNYLVFGNSDEVKVGQWVLAVGNPFNLESTVTAGIVSAKGRNINILRDQTAIESFIQTDAAVNPGNSGGALVNLKGELIGINTAIATPTGAFAGYSFAVPSNIASKVMEDLLKYGKVQRGFLGVTIRSLDGKLAKELGIDITEGVYVEGFAENSAAKDAGLKEKDIITAVDDKVVKSSPELQEIVGRKRPGDKVTLTILRDGKEKKIEVTLRTKEGETKLITKSESGSKLEELGAEFEDLTDAEKRKAGIAGGVKVKKLLPGKLRNQTDIREGFVITKVDKKPIRNKKELEEALKNSEGGVLIEGIYLDYPGTYYYGLGM